MGRLINSICFISRNEFNAYQKADKSDIVYSEKL